MSTEWLAILPTSANILYNSTTRLRGAPGIFFLEFSSDHIIFFPNLSVFLCSENEGQMSEIVTVSILSLFKFEELAQCFFLEFVILAIHAYK